MITRTAPQQNDDALKKWELGYYVKPGVQKKLFNEIPDVLENPDKGWVIHYYDNTLKRYGERLDHDDLADFEGFTVVYLRLAWCYLEPEEGKFNWDILDRQILRWTALGKKIAFRISCCEYGADQNFATPRWVMEAGCKGYYFSHREDPAKTANWEPDYGDPIFLEKLRNFLAAFAARYDGKPYVAFMDMGCYGIWGEWHTSSSSRKQWPKEVLCKMVDIHAELFKKTRLIILYGAGRDVCEYARTTCNAGLRSDSIGVSSYYYEFGGFWDAKVYPQLDAGDFGAFWPTQPVVLEPAHYTHSITFDTWQNGSTLENAVKALHASWATVHTWPREWLENNREYSRRLANKMGYWFFLKMATYPGTVTRNVPFFVQMIWENRGVAPVYKKYLLALSLVDEAGNEVFRSIQPSVDCRTWMPESINIMQPVWEIPAELPAGTYGFRVGLLEKADDAQCAIRLGVEERDNQGFYTVGSLTVE